MTNTIQKPITIPSTITLIALLLSTCSRSAPPYIYNSDRSFSDIEYQLSLGPRTPGSQAHAGVVEYIQEELEKAGWNAELQRLNSLQPVVNVIGKRGEGDRWIILGAHYDSRLYADNDPDPSRRAQPVPGANDGASGVAVLLELARSLPDDLPMRLWLVFFDAEDNGNIAGWDWILGSTAFVATLEGKPEAVVIVDMVGDADLNLPIEQNSTPELVSQIWQTASNLGYQQYFLAEPGYAMLDDHTPFLNAGIPAVDIIDFDYPYWHTTQDTLDKVSRESLEVVGKTLLSWLVSQP